MPRRIVSRATGSFARIRAVQFRGKRLRASAASYPLTVQPATLRISADKVLVAGASSFPLTGQAATMRLARRLAAGAASYPLAGQDASFRKGLTLVAGAASFPLTGQAATLRRARVIAAGVSSFPLTGISATLRKGLTLAAGAASFPLTGQAATLKRGMKVAAAAASYPLAGQAATLTKSGGTPAIVNSVGTNGPNSTSPASVSLPSSIVAGNKLVVLFGTNGSTSVTTPSDWTLVGTASNGSGPLDRKLAVFEKIADGSEGSTLSVTFGGAAWGATAYQISGSASATLYAGTGSSSANPDPPNNNPGTSAATLWIVGASKRQTTTLSSAPSGYSNLITGLSSGSNASVASADKTSTASSEDPGTFTGSGADTWAAVTLGIRT